jgi:hypothetical protein
LGDTKCTYSFNGEMLRYHLEDRVKLKLISGCKVEVSKWIDSSGSGQFPVANTVMNE